GREQADAGGPPAVPGAEPVDGRADPDPARVITIRHLAPPSPPGRLGCCPPGLPPIRTSAPLERKRPGPACLRATRPFRMARVLEGGRRRPACHTLPPRAVCRRAVPYRLPAPRGGPRTPSCPLSS